MKNIILIQLLILSVILSACQFSKTTIQNQIPETNIEDQLPETNIQICPEILYGDNFESNTSVRIVSIKGKEIDESRIDWAWVGENCY